MKRLSILAVLGTLLIGAPGLAQPTKLAPQTKGLTSSASGVEFNFQDVDLRVVLSALGEAAGMNVMFSSVPNRTVTLRTSKPVPVPEVKSYFESLIKANGMGMTQDGSLIRVSGEGARMETLVVDGTPGARSGSGTARLFVYQLRHAQADALAQTLTSLFGIGNTAPTGDAPAPARALSEDLRSTRVPSGSAGEAPATRAADPVQLAVNRSFNEGAAAGLQGRVQIVPDNRTNSILVRASPADYETMKAAIQQLDARPMQVMIEVLIAEVRRDKQDSPGITASLPTQALGLGAATVASTLTGGAVGDLALQVFNLGGVKADVALHALASSSNVTILSRPVVLAQNNQEARIMVGSERPFIQLFRSLPTDAAVRDQVVQYRDVGTQLTIRPTINPDGYVTMAVLQQVSNATAETQFGAPIISTREAKTQLMMKNNQTVVIGGLIDHQRETTSSGIPILKDIPVLGALFRSSAQTRTNVTEMFIFITPHVLKTDQDLDHVTTDLQTGTEYFQEETKNAPIPHVAPKP
jgi:general secretion pathway protein D